MTDDGPVYHALSVHLSRAKLITRFYNRYAEASPEFGTKCQREVPLFFLDIRISFQYSVDGKKLSCQKPARFVQPFRRFDKTPTCDRQTQTDRHRHRAIASARASTASRGQRLIHFSSFTSHELNSDVNTFVCFRIILPVTYFPYFTY